MASPFPGMDPYLERPAIWPGVLTLFLNQVVEQICRPLRPKYVARLEERVFVPDDADPGRDLIIPDVRVVESFAPGSFGRAATQSSTAAAAVADPVEVPELWEVEVRQRSIHITDADDRHLVAVIELLSPTNKVPNSAGRASFLEKRREVYETDAHWIEVDLLRSGVRTANVPGTRSAEYQAFLSQVTRPGVDGGRPRRRAFAWPMPLRERLPVIAIPLRGDDPAVPVDLQTAVATVVERGGYDLDFDYSRSPTLPLPPDDAEWAATLTDGFVAE